MTTVLNDIIPNPVIKQWILTVPPNTVYDHKIKLFLLELKKSEMNLTEDQLEEFDEAFNLFDSRLYISSKRVCHRLNCYRIFRSNFNCSNIYLFSNSSHLYVIN